MILACAWALAGEPALLPLPTERPPPRLVANPRLPFAGFRTQIPSGPESVSSRLAWVTDFDGATIGELTLRGQAAWNWFGLSAEVAMAAGASDRWGAAGLGNTRIDAALLVGPKRATHAIGLQLTVPTGDWPRSDGPLTFWGTVPDATTPTTAVSLAWTGATAQVGWHLHAGLRGSSFWGLGATAQLIDVAASLATVRPVAPRWFFVGEVELTNSQSWLHLRALARHELKPGWNVDAGVAVPLPAMLVDPTLQVVGQLQRSF